MFIIEVTFDSLQRITFHLDYLDDCANVAEAFLSSPDVASVYIEKLKGEK